MGFKKGNIPTKEVREKISLALLGKKRKPFSAETKEKMRLALIGNKRCLGKKNTLGMKGLWHFSEETKQKMSLAKRGEKHPRWGAGASKHNQKEYLRKTRNAVVEALGGACKHCGFLDKRALQIDHVNAGGSKERKERAYKGSFHKHVLQSFLAGENKYQLLCANCNWIKRFENDEARVDVQMVTNYK